MVIYDLFFEIDAGKSSARELNDKSVSFFEVAGVDRKCRGLWLPLWQRCEGWLSRFLAHTTRVMF